MSLVERLDRADITRLRQGVDETRPADVERILGRVPVSFSNFLTLLSPAASHYLEPMAQLAHQLTVQRFGRVILLYAPLYLSNECTNSCLYCGFNVKRPFSRISLTPEQTIAEAEYLKGWGFKHLLLVCGEAPKVVPVALLERTLRRLTGDFPSLSLEIYPLSVPAYAQLSAAGAEGLTLYQETYHRETYAWVHPAGRKRDFEWRLGSLERAGDAEFRRLGLGALLGLHDWRSEGIALALHADYLMKHYWRAQITISFPRLRHVPDGFVPPAPVQDAELVQLMLALRLFLPEVGLILSTREPATLRDPLIPLGLTQMSAGSRTEPGGYLHPNEKGMQFDVEDRRSPAEVTQAIRRAGYEPIWKDWDYQMHTLSATSSNPDYANYRQRENPAGA